LRISHSKVATVSTLFWELGRNLYLKAGTAKRITSPETPTTTPIITEECESQILVTSITTSKLSWVLKREAFAIC